MQAHVCANTRTYIHTFTEKQYAAITILSECSYLKVTGNEANESISRSNGEK